MRALTFFILFFSSISLFAQRQYTATEIANINTNSLAAGGDLYHDVANDILYIGLMTGKLVAINNTDDQKIDLFEINGSDVLSLSIESDGDAPKTVNLAPYSQTLSQAGDVVTLSNGGGSFTDNHLGTADQTLTGLRTVDLVTHEMRFEGNATTNARFRFINNGNFYVEDDSSPIILAQDNTNGVQTKLQSADNAGILGTVSAHSLQLRTDNSPVAQFETSGRFTLSNYGGDTFTGTMDNLLAVQSNGVVIEVGVDDIDDQDLSDGGRTGTDQTIDITNGNSVTFDVADNDNDSTNEIQDLGLSGNTLSLSSDPTTVNLAPYLDNTDNQNLEGATLTGTTLQIDIEDGNSTSVNLAGLRDADWYLPQSVNHATDILESIYTFGNVGININNPQHPLHIDSGNASSAGPWAVIEGGGNVRSNVALRLYDEGTAANNENILEFAHNPNTGVATPLATIRSNTVGNFHANGADLTLETTSNPTTINANQLVLKNSGNVGIGIADPQAKLDVDNGTVRFSDYGGGTVGLNTNAFLLGVDAQGDVVEVNNNNVGTDNQDLGSSASGTDRTITITGGNNTTISIADNDNNSSNELQTLSQTGDVVTLSNSGGSFTDNHLGSIDQTLTAQRTIDMAAFGMDVNGDAANNVRFRFQSGGNFYVYDDSTPIIGTIDNRNGVSTRMYSSNTVGVIGTNTNHLLQLRANNIVVAQLETDGQLRLNEYGGGAFTGTLDNMLGITSNGSVIEIDPASLDTDTNLSQEEVQDFVGTMVSGNTETGITVTYDDANNQFDFVATDPSSTNEIQDLSLTGNTLSLSSDATPVNLAPYLDNTDSQNLGSSASGTNRTITISGGTNTTINVADNDNDSSNELQTLSQTGDVVTLSNSGGSFTDNHLGTTNQTLTANRTVTQGNFDLNFDANTLVIDGSANNVGIGSTAPTEKLLVAGNIQAGEEGVGSMAMTINDGQGNANLTFNHTRGVPDGNGSSARIVSGVDAASAYMGFELASNVTAGTSVNSIEYLRIQNDGQVRMNDYGTGNFKEDDETYQLAVDANGDIVEMNTTKSSKIFYPPAIVIDVSTESGNLASPGDESINLYTRYTDAYSTPDVRSPSAPAAIPTYAANELHYYITDYDTSVFANVAVTDAGVMTYDVIDVPASNCTYINVVFVVK